VAVEIRLGLRENAEQFALLVGVNVLVGAMVGLERSVLPLAGKSDFGLGSTSAVLSFIAGFGAAKALANLVAGRLADRHGRRPVLAAGWALALPVPILIGLAPSWTVVVAANVLLGASQGLAWSMTVLMKIDLVGPRRRGLALGLNESGGYLGVAAAAALTGWTASALGARTVVWTGGAVLAVVGLAVTLALVRETAAHVQLEQAGARSTRGSTVVLAACSQAGFVNNLNDALAWGLAPIYLAAHGRSSGQIGLVAGVYPAVWGAGQLGTGPLSDRFGRTAPIVSGMLVQAAALAVLLTSAAQVNALTAAALLGLGTALVYPTLIAAVSDEVEPLGRARAVAVYRFWRDAGLVGGAILVGLSSDALGAGSAIGLVAALTGLSGLFYLGAVRRALTTGGRNAWQLT
jgi:MFS family permease